ncbi:glucose-1-phosphate thymidylyltransferase (plasmid) [Streptomyces sp. NBC_00390]|uniref:glucose-1-phosphate thymidylyltransferase n=1 Tax=Streptomyces sp. NBC_00390 TaxID=2975736 RepID=UPI002E1BEE83
MKALVLSGGSGTRLRPLSYSMPKQLVPVGNVPVLFHCLDNLRDADITDVGIVVGDRGDDIRRAVGDGSAHGLRVTYIQQEAPLGLAHCVQISEPFLGREDFVMYLGDNVLVGGVAAHAERFRADCPDAQLLVAKVADPAEYGIAVLGADGSVERLVEKPSEPVGDTALIGVYFFTKEVHTAVRSIEPSARGELEITDAIEWLRRNGRQVRAEIFDGYWKDTGRIEDMLDCNRVLLGSLTPSQAGSVDAHSELIGSGPIVIEPGARIERSRIVGPVTIGAGTVVQDSTVGPCVSIGRNGLLEHAEVEDSIVMDGAAIRGVRGIHGSLIGRNTEVSQAPRFSHRHRLVVGDHSRIEAAA